MARLLSRGPDPLTSPQCLVLGDHLVGLELHLAAGHLGQ